MHADEGSVTAGGGVVGAAVDGGHVEAVRVCCAADDGLANFGEDSSSLKNGGAFFFCHSKKCK